MKIIKFKVLFVFPNKKFMSAAIFSSFIYFFYFVSVSFAIENISNNIGFLSDSSSDIYCMFPSCYDPETYETTWISNGKQEIPNGCSAGIFRDYTDFDGFHECCNKHDLCWDRCRLSQAFCDDIFRMCLITACDANYENFAQNLLCQQTAELMVVAVRAARCNYIEAQKRLCKCK